MVTVDPSTSIANALRLTREHSIHHLVVTIGTKFLGVVSDRDLLQHVSPFAGTINERPRDAVTLQRPISGIATYHAVTTTPGATVAQAARLLLNQGISSLPVLDDDGMLVGIVTTRDLVRGLLKPV